MTAQAYLAAHQALYNAVQGTGTLCAGETTQRVYLPLIFKSASISPPETTEPPVSDLKIVQVFYTSDDEYVKIRNDGGADQAMAGWTLVSAIGTQRYKFPESVVIAAGQTIRIHSGPAAIDNPPNDLKWSGAYMWHNSGDRAELRSAGGALVDSACYGTGCS